MTISAELANTWRDEKGRFAEKGYVAADGGLVDIGDLDGELVEKSTIAELVEAYGLHDNEYGPVKMSDGASLYALPDDGQRYVALLEEEDGTYLEIYDDFYDVAYEIDISALESDVHDDFLREAKRTIVFHGTRDQDSFDSIKEGGIGTRNETRAPGANTSVGSAVFTTSNENVAYQYGADTFVFEIDLPQAIADGVITTDHLSREPGINEAEVLSGIAYGYDDDYYNAYDGFSSAGIDSATIIISTDIPPKYLKPYGNAESLTVQGSVSLGNEWRDEIGRFAPKGYTAVSSGVLIADAETLLQARNKAKAMMSAAPQPPQTAVIAHQADALLAREGWIRAGGERRGNSTQRAERLQEMADLWGDGEVMPCVHTGVMLAGNKEAALKYGLEMAQQDKLIVGPHGGGYTIDNLVPSSRAANQSRGDDTPVWLGQPEWGDPAAYASVTSTANSRKIALQFQKRRKAIRSRRRDKGKSVSAPKGKLWDTKWRGEEFEPAGPQPEVSGGGDGGGVDTDVVDKYGFVGGAVDGQGGDRSGDWGRVDDVGVVGGFGVSEGHDSLVGKRSVPSERFAGGGCSVGEVHGGHDSSLGVRRAVQFANPWRDERGRFAEKGYQANPKPGDHIYPGAAGAVTAEANEAARQGIPVPEFDGNDDIYRGIALPVTDAEMAEIHSLLQPAMTLDEVNQELYIGPMLVQKALGYEGHQGDSETSGLGRHWTTDPKVAASVTVAGDAQQILTRLKSRPRQSDIRAQEVVENGQKKIVDGNGNKADKPVGTSWYSGESEVLLEPNSPVDIVGVEILVGDSWRQVWGDIDGDGVGDHGYSARFTMSGGVAFANTWRDELGRFAPKGYAFVGSTGNVMSREFQGDMPTPLEGLRRGLYRSDIEWANDAIADIREIEGWVTPEQDAAVQQIEAILNDIDHDDPFDVQQSFDDAYAILDAQREPGFVEEFNVPEPPTVQVEKAPWSDAEETAWVISGRDDITFSDGGWDDRVTAEHAAAVLSAALVAKTAGGFEGHIGINVTDPRDAGVSNGALGWVNSDELPTAHIAPRAFMDYDSQSKSNFVRKPENQMATGPLVSDIRRITTHEIGHIVDLHQSRLAKGDGGFEAQFARQRQVGSLYDKWKPTNRVSEYGKSSQGEAYAEMFMEWTHTSGATNNPAVVEYAEQFGWESWTEGTQPAPRTPWWEHGSTPSAVAATMSIAEENALLPVIYVETGHGGYMIDAETGDVLAPDDGTDNLAASATIVEFANDWRDERGRFAPKGYVPSISTLIDNWTVDHKGEPTREAWALKHYGAIAVAGTMDYEMEQSLKRNLEGKTLGDEDLRGFTAELTNSVGSYFGDSEAAESVPLGLAMQLYAFDSYVRSSKDIRNTESVAGALDKFVADPTYENEQQVSFALEENYGITVESAAVNYVNRGWQQSSVGHIAGPSQIAWSFHNDRVNGVSMDGALASMNGYIPSGSVDILNRTSRTLHGTLSAVAVSNQRYTRQVLDTHLDPDATISLHRAMKTSVSKDMTGVQSNPLSSWTTDFDMAHTNFSGFVGKGGGTMTAEVPRQHIMSIATITGMGSQKESEVIVSGEAVHSVVGVEMKLMADDVVIFVDDPNVSGPDWIKQVDGVALTMSGGVELSLGSEVTDTHDDPYVDPVLANRMARLWTEAYATFANTMSIELAAKHAPFSSPLTASASSPMSWSAIVDEILADGLGDAFYDALVGVNVEIGFDIRDAVVERTVSDIIEHVRAFEPSIRKSTTKWLQKSLRDGLSVDAAVAALPTDSPLSPRQAYLTARTELIAASNNGAYLGYLEAGVKSKTWITARDDRVRHPTHTDMEGKKVDLRTDFLVDGFAASYPGDPRLPIKERIQCRCTIVPSFEPNGKKAITKKELYAQAVKREISGRSRMNKPQLQQALAADVALDVATMAQLHIISRARNIVGRYGMRKAELLAAIRAS